MSDARNHDEVLGEEERPSIAQINWVLKHVMDHMDTSSSYRYLIYDRMELEPDAYALLLNAGMYISNRCGDLEEFDKLFITKDGVRIQPNDDVYVFNSMGNVISASAQETGITNYELFGPVPISESYSSREAALNEVKPSG